MPNPFNQGDFEDEARERVTIWKEMFQPSPAREMEINNFRYSKAWDWMYEKNPDGSYIRAKIVGDIIRKKAKELRRRGVVGDVAQMATLDVYDLYGPNRSIQSSECENEARPHRREIAGIPTRKQPCSHGE